jgi:hypothetical protein
MREDLTWSCTHHPPPPPHYPAKQGQQLKFNSAFFGRFWVGPNFRTIGGPIILYYADVKPGTKVRIEANNGQAQLAVYQQSKSEGLFELLNEDDSPTGTTISVSDAIGRFSDRLTVASLPPG